MSSVSVSSTYFYYVHFFRSVAIWLGRPQILFEGIRIWKNWLQTFRTTIFRAFSGLFIRLQIKFGFGFTFSGLGLKFRPIYNSVAVKAKVSRAPPQCPIGLLPALPQTSNCCYCMFRAISVAVPMFTFFV